MFLHFLIPALYSFLLLHYAAPWFLALIFPFLRCFFRNGCRTLLTFRCNILYLSGIFLFIFHLVETLFPYSEAATLMLIFVKKSAATKTKIRILLKNIRIFCPPEKFYISLLLKISLFSFYTPFIFRKYFHFILAFRFLIVNILLCFFFIHQLYFCTFISPYITFQSQKKKKKSI